MWVADSAGEHPRQLTTEGFESCNWGSRLSPWPPDGKMILFNRNQNGSRIFTADLTNLLASPRQ